MTLIEEYYELNEAEEVPVIWKIIHIVFYVFAACLGLWCGYTMSILRATFDNCYLFSSIESSTSRDGNFDHVNIDWQVDKLCDYCQYSMVSSFIVATIWATFFLMCGKGGKSLTGLPQPWRIVWPSLIFNFIYFIVSTAAAINIQNGTDRFCGRMDFDKRAHSKSLIEKCEPLKLLLKKDLYITALHLEIVAKTSWACTVSWLILFLISFFRIVFVIDFQMYKICVFKIDDMIHNKKEEVLRITNYEEPMKLRVHERDTRDIYYDSVAHPQGSEQWNKKKTKYDNSMRRQFSPGNRSPMQPNAAFYVAADIRMLNREKKRKKSSKSLDETFEKNNSLLVGETGKPNKTLSHFDDSGSTDSSVQPRFLYRYPKEIVTDDIRSLSSATEKTDYADENWGDSDSEDEIFGSNLQIEQSIRFKKQM